MKINKLNNTFAEHLKNYELRDGLEKPFKQLVTYAFSKYHSNKHFDLKQLSAQKKKVETQLEKLEERFAIGEIGQDLYQKYTQKFSDD
jgi:iron-sulfur cluster repair protein YtfE (RIC family)